MVRGMTRSHTRRATGAAIGILASLAAGSAVAIVGVSSPAAATTCDNNRGCIWSGYDYMTMGNTLGKRQIQMYIPRLSQYDYNGTTLSANDSASSMHNNDNLRNFYGYFHPDCDGPYFTKAPNTTDSNFNNGSPGPENFNDELSAISFGNYLTQCQS